MDEPMSDDEEPEVMAIGPWLLKRYRKGMVWIVRNGGSHEGEGMEVGEDLLAQWIGDFYERHF